MSPAENCSGGVLRFFGTIWERITDLLALLKRCRFSIIMLLAGLVFLVWAPQGQDVLRGLVEWQKKVFPAIIKLIFFFTALILWAVNIWYWARTLLRISNTPPQYPSPPGEKWRKFLRKHIPRGLGVCAFAAVAVAFFNASRESSEIDQATMHNLGYLCLALGLVFYLVAIFRRKVFSALHDRLIQTKAADRPGFRLAISIFQVDTGDKDFSAVLHGVKELDRNSLLLLAASLLLSLSLFLLFLFWPGSAAFFGTATIVLLAASSWIAFGSMLIYFADAYRVPFQLLQRQPCRAYLAESDPTDGSSRQING